MSLSEVSVPQWDNIYQDFLAHISSNIPISQGSPNTISVALNKDHSLPRHSKTVSISGLIDTRKAASLKVRHSARAVIEIEPIEISEHGSSLDSKIWFMLNLENASMGKINRIPTFWFIKMLRETRDIENVSQEKLIKGRRVLIEKLLSRIGSFDHEIVKGVSIKSMLLPNEAKIYEVR